MGGLTASCSPYHGPGREAGDARDPYLRSSSDWSPGAFPWSNETLSWHKLDLIEAWLGGPEAQQRPELVPRARLELGEGRLALARVDRGRLGEADLDRRVQAAIADFRTVRTSPDASYGDRRRADEGLEEARRVLQGGAIEGTVVARSAASRANREPAGNAPGNTRRTIIPRNGWGAAAAIPNRLNREGGWRRITIHHSARHTSELGKRTLPSVSDAIRKIQKHHVETNGWGDIGYHYLIDPDGRVFEGRKAAYQGAHAGNSASNRNNVGICLLGHFDQERPSRAALASLQGLVESIRRAHDIPRSQVFSHKDFKTTECPGRFLESWLENYRSNLAQAPQH